MLGGLIICELGVLLAQWRIFIMTLSYAYIYTHTVKPIENHVAPTHLICNVYSWTIFHVLISKYALTESIKLIFHSWSTRCPQYNVSFVVFRITVILLPGFVLYAQGVVSSMTHNKRILMEPTRKWLFPKNMLAHSNAVLRRGVKGKISEINRHN